MNFEKEISSEMLYDIAKNTNLLEQYLQENSNRNSHLNLTMILDSLGFITEYLYTKKPICFINKFINKEELLTHFNEFGQMAIQQCYIAQSWKDIEKFINDVIINGNDYMKPQREEFFNKYLNVNKGCVGKYIVDYIKSKLRIE